MFSDVLIEAAVFGVNLDETSLHFGSVVSVFDLAHAFDSLEDYFRCFGEAKPDFDYPDSNVFRDMIDTGEWRRPQ